MNRKSALAALTVLLLVTALVMGGVAMAKKPTKPPKPIPGGCPWKDIQCLDVYDPVTCDNGVTYSNACYAFAACATGCSDGGANL